MSGEIKHTCQSCSTEHDDIASLLGDACETCSAKCDNCSKVVEYGDLIEFARENYCEDCHSELTSYCEHCDETVSYDAVQSVHDRIICDECIDNDFFSCNACNAIFPNDEGYTGNNENYCQDCWSENFSTCDGCSDTFCNDDISHCEVNDDYRCESCRAESGETDARLSPTFIRNPFACLVGYEIECFVKERPAEIREYGRIKDDGSLHADETKGGYGMEFASAPTNGDLLLDTVETVCAAIQANGGYTNKTCGLHVHIDMKDLTHQEKENVYYAWTALETVFFAATTPSRRSNNYCRMLGKMFIGDAFRDERYQSLNVTAFRKFGTFEWRLHHGTINASKIKGWITLLLNFVEAFRHINLNATTRKHSAITLWQEVYDMRSREKLLFLFQTIKMPLRLKKHFVARIHKYNDAWLNFNKLAKYGLKIEPIVSGVNETPF